MMTEVPIVLDIMQQILAKKQRLLFVGFEIHEIRPVERGIILAHIFPEGSDVVHRTFFRSFVNVERWELVPVIGGWLIQEPDDTFLHNTVLVTMANGCVSFK